MHLCLLGKEVGDLSTWLVDCRDLIIAPFPTLRPSWVVFGVMWLVCQFGLASLGGLWARRVRFFCFDMSAGQTPRMMDLDVFEI